MGHSSENLPVRPRPLFQTLRIIPLNQVPETTFFITVAFSIWCMKEECFSKHILGYLFCKGRGPHHVWQRDAESSRLTTEVCELLASRQPLFSENSITAVLVYRLKAIADLMTTSSPTCEYLLNLLGHISLAGCSDADI